MTSTPKQHNFYIERGSFDGKNRQVKNIPRCSCGSSTVSVVTGSSPTSVGGFFRAQMELRARLPLANEKFSPCSAAGRKSPCTSKNLFFSTTHLRKEPRILVQKPLAGTSGKQTGNRNFAPRHLAKTFHKFRQPSSSNIAAAALRK